MIRFLTIVTVVVMTSQPAWAGLAISFAESTPGSATIQQGVGGTAVVGVFVTSDGTGVTALDSFDIFLDIGGDGTGLPAGISFSPTPVTAGTVFTNAAVNPSSGATSPLANADIQISADRASFTFGATPTKLFDLSMDVSSAVSVGNFSVNARDDSGFGLMTFNNGGVNHFADSAAEFSFSGALGAIQVVAVPEPSSFLCLSLVIFVIGCGSVRKKRKLVNDA